MKQLALAIEIAVNSHIDQFDKGGMPYILHPLHVMNSFLYDEDLASIAVLHDVIEDSRMTIESLKLLMFNDRVLEALKLLTKVPETSYEDYLVGILGNQDAIKVKLKDLEHNSSILRLKGVSKKDLQRMEKYHKAYILLTKALKAP